MLGFRPLCTAPLCDDGAEGIAATLAVTLDTVALAATGVLPLKASVSVALDDVGLSFTGALALEGQASVTLDDATLVATGALPITANFAQALDGVGLTFTGALAIKAAVAVTLEDVAAVFAGEFGQTIVDTEVLQLPVNCVLAGQQPYKERGREWEVRPANVRSTGRVPRSGVRQLRGGRPSFTVTSNNRGYD